MVTNILKFTLFRKGKILPKLMHINFYIIRFEIVYTDAVVGSKISNLCITLSFTSFKQSIINLAANKIFHTLPIQLIVVAANIAMQDDNPLLEFMETKLSFAKSDGTSVAYIPKCFAFEATTNKTKHEFFVQIGGFGKDAFVYLTDGEEVWIPFYTDDCTNIHNEIVRRTSSESLGNIICNMIVYEREDIDSIVLSACVRKSHFDPLVDDLYRMTSNEYRFLQILYRSERAAVYNSIFTNKNNNLYDTHIFDCVNCFVSKCSPDTLVISNFMKHFSAENIIKIIAKNCNPAFFSIGEKKIKLALILHNTNHFIASVVEEGQIIIIDSFPRNGDVAVNRMRSCLLTIHQKIVDYTCTPKFIESADEKVRYIAFRILSLRINESVDGVIPYSAPIIQNNSWCCGLLTVFNILRYIGVWEYEITPNLTKNNKVQETFLLCLKTFIGLPFNHGFFCSTQKFKM